MQEEPLPRDGGAGGGNRTRKGLRPEMCEISAFTSFATPAPVTAWSIESARLSQTKRPGNRFPGLRRLSQLPERACQRARCFGFAGAGAGGAVDS